MHSFLDRGTSLKTDKLIDWQVGFCDQPFEYLLINWDGSLSLCCWDYDNLIDVGKITDSGLLDSYNSDKFNKVRLAMGKFDCRNIYPCNRCSAIYGKDRFKFFPWEEQIPR
jgi:hypothetical protein